MNEWNSGFVAPVEAGNLDRRLNRLASERAELFDRAGAHFGLSAPEHERLSMIERQLDECFLARRRVRAERNARRFERERPFLRRAAAVAQATP
jgi:hypothetical protein